MAKASQLSVRNSRTQQTDGADSALSLRPDKTSGVAAPAVTRRLANF